ncbi:MAG: TrkH family potassium uptake protein [Lachnospiraceae bacterium]|nr:TrkH family potassium uptake protein [Lachnospiraceae bacterium]
MESLRKILESLRKIPDSLRQMRLSRTRLIMGGFLIIILVGACLLMLPFATRSGEQTTFLGALFTAVSSTCVTGLVVYDTWSHWTMFGQLVLLTLIQIGGLGFITIGSFAMILLGKKIGLAGRELIHESLSTLQLRGSVHLVRHIVCGTLLFEGTGAILLSIRFVPQMGLAKGIYYGIFHAISAFCNAGFDLMGFREPYSSFCAYASDPLVNLILIFLILIGGLGFIVWEDLLTNRWHWRRYALQTKIVLTATIALTVGGTILFLISERSNLFAQMGAGEQFWCALFSSVTPRTAGFNTVDTAALTNGSKILTMCLMFIGGSPGSTAGGIKTTTIVVILLYIRAYLLRNQDLTAFQRRLGTDVMKRASVVVFINYFLALTAILILLIGQDLPLADVLFEAFSAIGTVGMSTGVTRELNTLSRIVIMILMFLGRVGSLSFAMSFTEKKRPGKIRYPEAEIIVG